MHKFKIFLLLIVALSSLDAKNIVIDNLNETKHINVSRSDVNRFVFPSAIKTHVTSQEKDLMVTITGNELYIKFEPYQETEVVKVQGKTVEQPTDTIVYDKAKVNELFVVTKNKTYSFILHPKKQELTTVILTESFQNKVENIRNDLAGDTDYVKNIANNLIYNVLNNNPLRGYEEKKNKSFKKSIYINEIRANMDIELINTYEGYKYLVEVYEVTNDNNFILSIPDAKQLLYSVVKKDDYLVAYSLYYDNRIYKILPNEKAKLIIIKHVKG